MPWILLWLLYITLCRSPGLEIALRVPSMNPKKLSAPLAEIASAYICKETGFKIPLFQFNSYLAVVGIIYVVHNFVGNHA